MYDAPAFGEELVIQDYELDDVVEPLQSSHDVGSLSPGTDKAYIEDLVHVRRGFRIGFAAWDWGWTIIHIDSSLVETWLPLL